MIDEDARKKERWGRQLPKEEEEHHHPHIHMTQLVLLLFESLHFEIILSQNNRLHSYLFGRRKQSHLLHGPLCSTLHIR